MNKTYYRIDPVEVNRKANLLMLTGGLTRLRRVAATGGGEYAGSCPFCPDHGVDRFRVQPYHQPYGLWMCHYCTAGKWKDAIDYGRRLWPTAGFREICERLVGQRIAPVNSPEEKATHFASPAAAAPNSEWQRTAWRVVEEAEKTLWDARYSKVLDILRARGLHDETISHFRLGYLPTGNRSEHGRKFEDMWVPRGIIIPGIVNDAIWYIKVRLVPGLPCVCEKCSKEIQGAGKCPACGKDNKYRGVKGNKPSAIFNGDAIRRTDSALIVEGEFDCMIAHQEFGDLIPAATLGSATNLPDLATWGPYFVNKNALLLTFDSDIPGQKGLEAFIKMTSRSVLAPLPAEGWKDINDFHLGGGNLRQWIETYLNFYIDKQSDNNKARFSLGRCDENTP